MKHQIGSYIVTLVAILLTVGCQRTEVRLVSNPEEIRELNHQVLKAANESPDSAMLMIDSLKSVGTLPDYRCDYLRAKIYAQSPDIVCLDSAIIIGEGLMTLDVTKVNMAYRQDVLEMLVNAGRQHDDEQTIHWCALLIDLCRQQGDEAVALRNEAELGCMLAGIGKTDEGLAKIDSAIQLLSANRKWEEMDACIIALRRKIEVLNSLTPNSSPKERGVYSPSADKSDHSPLLGRGAGGEVIAAAQQILDLLADYEQHPDEFHDGSYREMTEEQRPGYIEFYRAKAYMYMAWAYAKAPLSSPEGDTIDTRAESIVPPSGGERGALGAARHYLSLFEQCAFAKTLQGRTEIAPTWCLLGEYDKMSAAYDEYEARLREQGDTVNTIIAGILRDRALAAKAQGRLAESLRLHEQYETLTETLHDRLFRSNAHLYAARYHASEQQREIERKASEVRLSRLLNALLAAILIGVITLSVVLYIQKRRTKRKNRILATQIQEAMAYHEQLMEQRRLNAPSATALDGFAVESLDDSQLFAYLSDLIEREQLFLASDFGRQTLIDRTGLSKERIGAAFAHGSDHDSLSAYVRNLRLEFAVQLLTDRPGLSITQVSAASGFTVPETFTRQFRARYGMSPTAFRRSKGLDLSEKT